MAKTPCFQCRRPRFDPCSGNWGFPSGSDGKESACSAEKALDPDLIPGSGRSPGEGMATHSCILAWEVPWAEEPGRLQSAGLQKSRSQLSS